MNISNASIIGINKSATILTGLIDKYQGILEIIKWLVGGLFGLYVIILAAKLYELWSVKKILKELKSSIKKLDKKIDRLEKKK
ncbi:MAG: hypothetical protein ACQESF_01595 [Nanobdellota archaeon]